jgi:branched-chain amino acid transport system substrate-binding protein
MKAYGDLGLKEAGIKLIGPQDITTEEELANMGDVPVDVITAGCYSDVGDRPANKEFVAAWKKEYGDNPRPNFMSAGAWDGMHAIFDAIIAEKGKLDPAKTMEILANWKNPNSPKGPVSIDPKTHDIIQNIYIRKVEKRNGLLVNVEFDKIEAVKDPWKELNPGK